LAAQSLPRVSKVYGAGVGVALRRFILISADLLFVALATAIAIWLRANLDPIEIALTALIPYVLISHSCAAVVFLVGGLDRTPWRYSTVADHFQIIVLTVLVILLAVVVTFVMNRLEGVARSLPVLQGALIAIFLVSVRSVARFWYARRIHSNGNGHSKRNLRETVLIVGVNTVSELFLLSVQEFASRHVQVAGVVADEPRMRGRAIQQKPVLGTVDELQQILQSLEVHGTLVDRIVVATPRDRLAPRALKTLLEVEESSNIVIQFLSHQLGLEDSSQAPPVLLGRGRSSEVHAQRPLALVWNRDDVNYVNSARKSYRRLKRIIDGFGAALLIVALAPVAALIALVVALDVGFPLIFWQQRPGLYGRPFKLYKFRTMRAPHDKYLNRIHDDQRSSTVGQLLRRSRLDELPQLYNVLVGDMSLIGPRPLLQRDQSPDYAARLSVRPGITGWAQVNGGRIISPSDKCILDIWYAQNASFVLDFDIILRTAKMVFFGDRLNTEAVNQARNELALETLPETGTAPAE
jgi:lipopolysaccharide/colanic/teichoic acid biosynthesis glycosyltransferase